MTIIPYIRAGCLDSNTSRHFNTIRDAVKWVFDEFTKPDSINTIQRRFRIIDTEEDFAVSFSKKDGDIIAPIGWFGLCGINKLSELDDVKIVNIGN